jgi:O-glycosyl hydrolase
MKGSDFIRIGAAKTFQSIDGMGSSFESSTCFNLSKLDPAEREITFKALLTGYSGINLNLMRIFISMPDFKGDTWYSYCDLPKGETDTLLQKFSIAQDENYILPFLREALRIKPSPRFFASPWSPPTWMKTSGDLTGGRLKPEYYAAYARYCVKYIKAYEAAGIPVFAVTLQKEPRVNCEFDLYHFIDKITQ